jgi:hypothetical protein
MANVKGESQCFAVLAERNWRNGSNFATNADDRRILTA